MRSSLKTLVLAGASVLAIALAGAPAQADTTVNTGWNGGGLVTQTGSATNSSSYAWSTNGGLVAGSSSFKNLENNPYGYGVSNTSLDLNGTVNSGYITSMTSRDGSYTPLYGGAGQSVSASAFSSDGNAALVQHASVNYAGLQDLGHYGVTQTPNGNTLEASGTSIQLNYAVNTGAVGSAGILVTGSGSASYTQNYAGASAKSFSMGVGGGDYQLGTFNAQGSGTMQTGAAATKSISIVNNGGTVFGTVLDPASVTTTVHYNTTGAPAGTVQTWNAGISGSN